MEITFRVHAEPLQEGGFVVTSPDVPGLVAQGRTLAEACEIAQSLARKIVESCVEHGDALPAIFTQTASPAAGYDLVIPLAA